MLWDITTKFLPVEDLMRSQLFTNFDGYSLKNGAATPLTIWNFSRAWQAYFLSNNLQIWRENTSFNDLQMIWNNVFDTSIGFWFEKIWLSCTVHSYSLYLNSLSFVWYKRMTKKITRYLAVFCGAEHVNFFRGAILSWKDIFGIFSIKFAFCISKSFSKSCFSVLT